jgi:hypothetical protein
MAEISDRAFAVRLRVLIDVYARGSVSAAAETLDIPRERLASVLRLERRAEVSMMAALVRTWNADPLWLLTGETDVERLRLEANAHESIVNLLTDVQLALRGRTRSAASAA